MSLFDRVRKLEGGSNGQFRIYMQNLIKRCHGTGLHPVPCGEERGTPEYEPLDFDASLKSIEEGFASGKYRLSHDGYVVERE